MFSHVFLGTSDFLRAMAFYRPLMAALGHRLRFEDRERPWAGWQPAGQDRPLLLVGAPFDAAPHVAGNGQMVALACVDRAQVQLGWHTALAHGGRCEGPPGLRAHYHPDYFGAYVRDPDGNKLCLVCHQPG